jgi:hypothetical protein
MESDSPLAGLSKLVNSGHPEDAFSRGELLLNDERFNGDAHLYFVLALAESLMRPPRHDRAADFWAGARSCANYDAVLEGDFRRDEALAFLRIGDADSAETALEESSTPQYLAAPDRPAINRMVDARIRLERGDAAGAYLILRRLRFDEHPQWVLNARLHTLRALAAMRWSDTRRIRAWRSRWWYLDLVLKYDPNREHRIRACLLACFGRLGYKLDRAVMRQACRRS